MCLHSFTYPYTSAPGRTTISSKFPNPTTRDAPSATSAQTSVPAGGGSLRGALRVGTEPVRVAVVHVRQRRDLRGFDLAAPAPEHVGVAEVDARFAQVRVDRGF